MTAHRLHRSQLADGTVVEDDVRFALPLGALGALALPLVRRDLGRIFDHRRDSVAVLLG